MSHVESAKPVNPTTLVFERMTQETMTVQIHIPDGTTDRDIEGWANFGAATAKTQLETVPTEQILSRDNSPERWKLVSATPPLGRVKAPKTDKAGKTKVRGKK